jgi:hypothetical protein
MGITAVFRAGLGTPRFRSREWAFDLATGPGPADSQAGTRQAVSTSADAKGHGKRAEKRRLQKSTTVWPGQHAAL